MESSAVLRAVLESGTSPQIERSLRNADVLITSRLSIVECARAIARMRLDAKISAAHLDLVADSIAELWRHCEIWELTADVCDVAAGVAPRTRLRALDALHVATFMLARRKMRKLKLLTADERVRAAIDAV